MTIEGAPLRVLDASESVAGQFAARLFADHGAEVTLAEPPGGSAIRRRPPFRRASEHAYDSLLFDHLNAGKASRVASSQAEVDRLVASADIAIVSANVQLDLQREWPLIAAGRVEDFQPTGPYGSWRGGELVHQALSGSMYVTGDANREPLFGVGHRSSYATGVWLYVGLQAVLHAHRRGEHHDALVTVSQHEAAVSMEQNLATEWMYSRHYPRRGDMSRPRGRATCRDGWVAFFVLPGDWAHFCAVFEQPQLADDPRFRSWPDLVANWSLACESLTRGSEHLSIDQVLRRAATHRLAVAPIVTPLQAWDHSHYDDRGFWIRPREPTGHAALGPMFRFSNLPVARHRSAPCLARVSATPEDRNVPQSSMRDRSATSASCTPQDERPLNGIRVVDLTTAWAGPMATRILGYLGADIIKVEGPSRPDGWRGPVSDPPIAAYYPDGEPGEDPINRHAFFNNQNQDKRSLVVDLKDARGLDAVRGIVGESDLMIANSPPGVLDRLGLGFDELSRVNRQIIVVEMPAFGLSGPAAAFRGLGPTMEAMTGIAGLIGYRDEPPLGSGTAYLDPMSALHGAAAALTAINHRHTTGRGQHVEVAQSEAAMHWIGEILLDCIERGQDRLCEGNDVGDAAPHGAYPTAGDDEWIAIAISDDADWEAFLSVIGDQRELSAERFKARRGRLRWRRDLDGLVSASTSARNRFELADALQSAGVAAAPVLNGRDLAHDPHLRATDWYHAVDHPSAGRHDYPRLPVRLGDQRMHHQRPAPTFGQHSREILSSVLRLGDADIDALVNAGVVVVDSEREMR